MTGRLPPVPPRPELERRPKGAFGWLEAKLLHDGWLAEVGPHAAATLVLLARAADRGGGSFFGRDRMAAALGMTRYEIDQTLQRLLDAGLVAHRPHYHQASDLPATLDFSRMARVVGGLGAVLAELASPDR